MSEKMTRKDFLSSLAFGGATLALFPWLSACSSERQRETAGEKARLGIIGTGSRGQFHLVNLLQDPAAQIVALCDDYPRTWMRHRPCARRPGSIRITGNSWKTRRWTESSSARRDPCTRR